MGNSNRKLSSCDIAHLLLVTNYSETKLHELHRKFIRDFPSGLISPDEFKKIFATFFPDGIEGNFSAHIFRAFDLDCNGSIDFREFTMGLNVTSKGSVKEKLEWAFSIYDLNSDGRISREEMLEVITNIYDMIGRIMPIPNDNLTHEQRVDKIFRQMDTNHDGELSMEEFVEGANADPSIRRLLECNLMDDFNRKYE